MLPSQPTAADSTPTVDDESETIDTQDLPTHPTVPTDDSAHFEKDFI